MQVLVQLLVLLLKQVQVLLSGVKLSSSSLGGEEKGSCKGSCAEPPLVPGFALSSLRELGTICQSAVPTG